MRHSILIPFLLIVLLALPLVSAVDDACVFQLAQPSGDYYCELASDYQGQESFNTYCLENGGVLKNKASDECQQVCCCELTTHEPAWSAPVSKAFCAGLSNPDYGFFSPAESCVTACGGTGGGGTGDTYTVTGTVIDDDPASSTGQVSEAKIQFPAGSDLITVFAHNDGTFTLTGVSQGLINFKASKVGCGQQQIQEDISSDTAIEFHLDCSIGLCALEAVNDTVASPVPGADEVTVSWTPSDCTEGQGYLVSRCDDGDCARVGFASPGAGSYTDTGVPAGVELCYNVTALDATGKEIPQDVDGTANCVAPMSQYCLDGGATTSTCFYQDQDLQPLDPSSGQPISPFTGAAHCTATTPVNQVEMDKECGTTNQVCYYQSDGKPGCRLPSECDDCNGVFGWFIDLAAKVTGSDDCAHLAGCVQDNHGYADDTFSACTSVTSCYDYRSQAACESGTTTDPCKVSDGGCRWLVPPELADLGKGVCTPKNAGASACEDCASIFGFCDDELCTTMGENCYWNTKIQWGGVEPGIPQNAAGQCLSKEAMACAYYDTEKDCVGSPSAPVSVDVTYDGKTLDSTRIGGTHAVMPSGDKLGFGRCAWIAGQAAKNCIKDANGLRAPNPSYDNIITDDCLEAPGSAGVDTATCFRDVEPPVTTMPFANGAYIDAQLLRSVPPIVQDAVYGNLDPRTATRFCLTDRGVPACYPDTSFDNLLPAEVGVAPYTIYYYSFDPAGNLEPVRSIDVNIDRDASVFLLSARLVDIG